MVCFKQRAKPEEKLIQYVGPRNCKQRFYKQGRTFRDDSILYSIKHLF